jgi:hypothetical protein
MTKSEKLLAWGGAALATVLVAFGIYEEVKKKPPSSSGPTNPVWQAVAPAADGSFTFAPNQTYALSMLSTAGTGAAVQQVSTDLSAAAAAGTISPTQGLFPAPVGTAAPTGWPAGDNAGVAGARWEFVGMGSGYTLPASDAGGVSAWILTGYT